EPLLVESLDQGGRFLANTTAVLGERQRLRLLAAKRMALDVYLSSSAMGGPRAADLYRHVLDWKGAVDAQRTEARAARDWPDLRPLLDELAGIRARLARLAFATPPAAGRALWWRELDALRDRKEGLEADLARQSASYRREEAARRQGADELAAALPEGMAL